MAIQLISYDLIAPGRDYSKLHEAIKNLGNWWHCLESTWIVNTSRTVSDIRDTLKNYVDDNDRLLVVTLGTSWASWRLSQQCNDWLRNNI